MLGRAEWLHHLRPVTLVGNLACAIGTVVADVVFPLTLVWKNDAPDGNQEEARGTCTVTCKLDGLKSNQRCQAGRVLLRGSGGVPFHPRLYPSPAEWAVYHVGLIPKEM